MRKLLFAILTFALVSLPLLFPKDSSAQGTFDCKWIYVGGMAACKAANIKCETTYEANFALCGDLTPSGAAACTPTGQECVPLGTGTKQTPSTEQSSPLGKGDCDTDELDTAIGCIPIGSSNNLIGFVLKWAIGIGGGIAFLLIIYSGFIILTSQGDPKRLQAGQELLSSALMGLILLIFSVFILRVIGVKILDIPGL